MSEKNRIDFFRESIMEKMKQNSSNAWAQYIHLSNKYAPK